VQRDSIQNIPWKASAGTGDTKIQPWRKGLDRLSYCLMLVIQLIPFLKLLKDGY